MIHPMLDKAKQYLASAKAAEEQAAFTANPQLKTSFRGIARLYRQMADRARKLSEDEAQQRDHSGRR